MLHQENNNEERRLKSKGLTGLGPIKTSDVWLVESVGEERIERKKKNRSLETDFAGAVCKMRKQVLSGKQRPTFLLN